MQLEIAADFRVLQSIGDIRLEIAKLAAAIVAHTRKLIRQHTLLSQQCSDAIRKLDLGARARLDALQVMKDTRCEYVTSHDTEARRRRLRLRLLDDGGDRVQIALAAPGFHNAVLACFSAGHELNTEQGAA